MKQFKPETCALVLIDYQVGTLQLIRSMSSDVSLRNVVILAKAAIAFGMPVVLTTSQKDQIQGPLAQSLQKVLPDAYKNCVKRIRPLWNVMLIAALGYYVGWWLPWPIFGYHAPNEFSQIDHITATVITLAGLFCARQQFSKTPMTRDEYTEQKPTKHTNI